MHFGGHQGVFKQHGPGHWTYAARDGCDISRNFLDSLGVDVAAKLAVFVTIHPHVNHNRTGLYHIGSNKLCLADCRNKNICTKADFLKVLVLEWQMVTVPFS